MSELKLVKDIVDWCDKHDLSFSASGELDEIISPYYQSIPKSQIQGLIDRWKVKEFKFKDAAPLGILLEELEKLIQ